MLFWDWFLLVVSCFLIIIIILQESKEDASSAFTGEKSALNSERKKIGIEVLISRTTTVLSVLMFVLAFVCAFLVERI